MWIRIILALLLCYASAWASVDSTNGKNGDFWNDSVWTDGSAPAAKTDTIIVKNGDSLFIESTVRAGDTDTTCLVLFIREGGVVDMNGAGSRINPAALWLGGNASAPFADANGGRFWMGPSDTVGLWDEDIMGADDIYVTGNNSQFDANGGASNTRAVIYTIGGSALANIYVNGSNSIFNASYVKFYGLHKTVYAGLDFSAGFATRNNTKQKFEYCIFDSVSFYAYDMDGENIKSCTTYSYKGQPITAFAGLFMFDDQCSDDTLSDCYFYHDNDNNAASHGANAIWIQGRKCVVYNSTILSVNTNGDNGMLASGIALAGDSILVRKNSISLTQFGIISSSPGAIYARIDSNVLFNNGHENIYMNPEAYTDSAWQIYGNHVYLNDFKASFLIYVNTDMDMATDILYNTFHAHGISPTGYPIEFDNVGALNDKIIISGLNIVGNIFVHEETNKPDFFVKRDANDTLQLVCDEFKNNAYDSIFYDGSIAIAGAAYDIADSNSITDAYGFVDSTNHDRRLVAGSPMLNAGDSVFWVQAFEPADSSDAPGNIGYYQGAGIGGEPAATAAQVIIIGGN